VGNEEDFFGVGAVEYLVERARQAGRDRERLQQSPQ